MLETGVGIVVSAQARALTAEHEQKRRGTLNHFQRLMAARASLYISQYCAIATCTDFHVDAVRPAPVLITATLEHDRPSRKKSASFCDKWILDLGS